MIHPLADCQSNSIGKGTYIWQFCVILKGAVIGANCNINANVFIENDVVVGENTTIKCGVQLWDGVHLGKNVFVGPNVTFTNDFTPRSKAYPEEFPRTNVLDGVSIGANSTILPGLTLGEFCMIGAGAVVTKNIPARALVVGNPAKIVGWVDNDGKKMKKKEPNFYVDSKGELWQEEDIKLKRVKE